MLGVLPKSQGIAEKKMTSQNARYKKGKVVIG